MKKILSIVISITLLLSLCACKEVEKAETTVNNYFAAMTNKDKTALQKYVVSEDENNTSEDENSEAQDPEALDEYSEDFWNAFSKVTYEIKSSERDAEDKKKVNVSLDVTSVDLASLYQSALNAALENAFANIFSSEANIDISDEAYDRFAKSISDGDVPMTTTSVIFSVIKTDDGWKIEANDEFYDAITGGFVSYINSIGNSVSAN